MFYNDELFVALLLQVLSQLQIAVENWNPLTDAVPLHSWIHPWRLHMNGSLLEPLYQTIRGKLANALRQWDPRDSSALIILKPWFGVFSPGNWDGFMFKNIIPKLSRLMQTFVVDPSNQDLKDFNNLLSWQNLLPPQSLVTILDKYFFPQWLKALSMWLNNGNANFSEIADWYEGWNAMFPPKLMENPFIVDRFNAARDMMSRAISENPLQNLQNNIKQEDELSPIRGLGGATVTGAPRNIKDIIQEKAEKSGILFLPIARNTDGQALYQFGEKAIISIKKDVIFRKIGDSYVPISVGELFS